MTEEEVLAMSELELQEVMEDVRLECLRYVNRTRVLVIFH